MTTNHARDSMTKIRFTTPINPKDPEAPREKKYRSRAEVTNPVATEYAPRVRHHSVLWNCRPIRKKAAVSGMMKNRNPAACSAGSAG